MEDIDLQAAKMAASAVRINAQSAMGQVLTVLGQVQERDRELAAKLARLMIDSPADQMDAIRRIGRRLNADAFDREVDRLMFNGMRNVVEFGRRTT